MECKTKRKRTLKWISWWYHWIWNTDQLTTLTSVTKKTKLLNKLLCIYVRAVSHIWKKKLCLESIWSATNFGDILRAKQLILRLFDSNLSKLHITFDKNKFFNTKSLYKNVVHIFLTFSQFFFVPRSLNIHNVMFCKCNQYRTFARFKSSVGTAPFFQIWEELFNLHHE